MQYDFVQHLVCPAGQALPHSAVCRDTFLHGLIGHRYQVHPVRPVTEACVIEDFPLR